MNGLNAVRPAIRGGVVGVIAAVAGLAMPASAQWLDDVQVIGDPRDGDLIVQRYTRPASLGPSVVGFGAGSPLGGLDFDITYTPTGVDAEGDGPSDARFTPDGTRVVISHRESRNLIVLDAATRAFVRAIPVGGAAQSLAISPDGVRAFVACVDTDEVVVVNLNTGAEIARIPVGESPGVVRINSTGTLVAVGNTFDSSISVIDGGSLSVVRTITGLGFTITVSFTPESGQTGLEYPPFEFAGADLIVHADRFNDLIHIASASTGAVTSLPCADAPHGVAVNSSGSTAVISHVGSVAQVSVVDPATGTIVKTIAMASTPWGAVSINPSATKAVVAIQNAAVVVDLVTNAVSANISTATNYQLYTTPDGLYAQSVGFQGTLISYATGTAVGAFNQYVNPSFGAMSPVGTRAALVSANFGEDVVMVRTNGSGGGREGFALTGPEPEFDRTRTGGMTPDGSRTAVVGIVSDSLAVLETDTGAALGRTKTGQRPGGAGMLPDGSRAVVANLDDFFATVYNVSTNSSVTVPMGRRAGLALIHPSGSHAYLPVVADGDGVYRINLTTSLVEGAKLPTGDMGSVGYAFFPVSGAAISPDGSTLVTCGSFSNTITLIDTASWSVLANVPVDTFPTYAAFSPDGSRIYVSCSNGSSTVDTVAVIANAGAASNMIASIPVGNAPWEIEVGTDRAYVLNTQNGNSISVIDRATNSVTSTVPLPTLGLGIALDETAERLYVATGDWLTTLGGNIGFTQSETGTLYAYDTESFIPAETYDTQHAPSSLIRSAGATSLGTPAPGGDGVVLMAATGGGCEPDLTTTAIPGSPGYGLPNGTLNNDDFFYFLAAFAAGNVAVADLTTTAVPGSPGFGVPNGVVNNDDFFYYLSIFAAGC